MDGVRKRTHEETRTIETQPFRVSAAIRGNHICSVPALINRTRFKLVKGLNNQDLSSALSLNPKFFGSSNDGYGTID